MAGLGSIAPLMKLQLFTNGGLPAAGYQLFSYEAGTTTKLDTYSDVDLAVPNANPIVLDSAGRATVFLSSLSYKFVFTSPADTDPPTSPIWTVDGIGSAGSVSTNQDVLGIAGEALTFGQCVYLSDGALSKVAGRYYLTHADAVESSSNVVVAGFVTADAATGTACNVRLGGRLTGLSALVTGAPYYCSNTPGAIQTTVGSNTRTIGQADSSSSLIVYQAAKLFKP